MNLDRLRLFLSVTMTILFFVTTATVLFFTFGYRFSFERGIFVYTGSITMKSNPRDVSISIDHSPVSASMRNIINQSTHLTGIDPGEHFLHAEANGFQSWEKKVTVQSGYSTEFWNVLLPRVSYPAETLATGPYHKAYLSPKGHYIALSGERDGEVFVEILDKDTGKRQEVFSSRSFVFADEPPGDIDWSKDESRIIIRLTTDAGNKTVFLVDRETKQATNLADIVTIPNPRLVRWHPDRNNRLFALFDSTLYFVDTKTSDPASRLFALGEDISAYDLVGNSIYTFKNKDGIVYRSQIGDGTSLSPTPVTEPITSFGSFETPILVVYNDRRIAIFEQNGHGILYNDDGDVNPSVIPLMDDVQGALFSDDGKKFLFFSENEISVAFTHDWEVQPTRKSGDVIQLVRFSSPLSSVEWTKDYEHVTFVLNGTLMFTELDNRDRRQTETLTPSPSTPLRNVSPSFSENRLYFFSAENGLSSLRFIRFPEDTGFFGG